MDAVIEEFDKRCHNILDPFADKINSSPPPDIIYHYTDDAGLRGILESGKLWFTDIFKLNDPSELRHGLELAFKIFGGYRQYRMAKGIFQDF
jgi:hypothetical protein